MKKLYPKVPSVFAFLLFFTHAIPTLAVNHGKTKPLIEADQLAQIRQHIEFSEYFIRWQNSEGIYQSPNRKNSLYASYTGQEINIAPSGKVQEQWSFSLTVKSVKADGRSVYKPTDNPLVIIDDNTIQFNHDNQFIVEYVNNEQGIRQNFIIQQQPAAYTQKLSIQLQPSAGWETLKQNATSLSFKNQQQQLTYNDLKVWDAKGRKLPARFSVHNNLVEINVDAENAEYPVTIDPLVANGTPQNANTFLQSNQVSALMGYSVSSAGDVNGDGYDDVILSALYYDNGQTDEGAAFVYYGSSRGINPTTYTLLEGNISAGGFGSSVSGAGDVDGDGYDDVIVGASHTPLGSLTNAGAIYVFYGSASGIKNTTPDIVQGTYQNDYLGENVSGAGDVNGDGYDDLMAGAWNASRGQANEGIVYIYYGGPWGILYTASSMLEGNIANLSFGSDVSSAGDVNVDGYDDVVIGAVDYNSGGAAYIYYGSSGGVELSPATILESSVQSSSFGLKVAGAGDILIC
jgi:hypothetical protein